MADITYIATWAGFLYLVPTWAGFLYLAVVLDAWSRRIVGWAMKTTLHTQLVLDALSMALEQQRPGGVIHHSDQGSQYTLVAFGKRCREAGVQPSMGSVGDCYDNAMCESFFATLECERIERSVFRTPSGAQQSVFAFIEGSYNPRRRPSALGQVSPSEFEAQQSLSSPEGSLRVSVGPSELTGVPDPVVGAGLERSSTESAELSAEPG